MKRKEFNYLVSVICEDKTESMIVKAKNIKEAKSKVADVISKSSLWNFNNKKIELDCKRINLLEGGNYEFVNFRRKDNR